MTKAVYAPWDRAVPSTIDENGVVVHGEVIVAIMWWGPDEEAPSYARPLSEIVAEKTDPTTGLITQHYHTGDATMDPEQLRGIPLDTPASMGFAFRYPDAGPKPELCSCGVLSFRHAVSYHVTAG